jgi:TolB-like protein/DNA-binding winged helix-turn-helix (wHTH) protein
MPMRDEAPHTGRPTALDAPGPQYFEFAGFRLNRGKWTLLNPDGAAVSLTPKAFDALVYFLEHPGQVIERSTLLDALWPNTVVEENSLSQIVAALRRTLGDGFIVTVPRRGYQFVADVRVVADTGGPSSSPAAGAATHGRSREREVPPLRRARRTWAYVSVAALLLVAAAVFALVGGGLLSRPARPVQIAVLPFVDVSAKHDQGNIADGIATELLTTLSQIDGLAVRGRTSSFYFKDHSADLRTIDEMLDVDYVLEGEVVSSDDRLRIAMRLSETATGTVIWNDSYDRVVDEYFALQDDIARSVAQALQITLGVGDLGTRIGMTHDPRAFMAFLEAGRMSREGSRFSPADIRKAIPYLEQAVALDDSFALAWFELYYQSRWLNTMATNQGGSAPGAADRAQEALARVRELTPQLPELALSEIDDASDAYDLARTFERILEGAKKMNYPPADILLWRARLLLFTGRVAESKAVLERARVFDPLNAMVIMLLAEGYAAEGQPAAALELLDDYSAKIGESRPGIDIAGTALVMALETGDTKEIVARLGALQEAHELLVAPGQTHIVPPGTYARLADLIDEPDSALAALRAFAASSDKPGALWPTMLAPWAAYFGDDELALEMYRHEVPFATGNTISRPVFRGMRRLAGFKELVGDKGFVSYWRESGHWPDYCRPLGSDDFECF